MQHRNPTFNEVHPLRFPALIPPFIRKLFFLLPACLGVAACDDVIFTDGRTIAEGYVTDSLTNQCVEGAKVYLYACNSSVYYPRKRCRTVIDSAATNADGYYRFRFRDQRRTNFAVSLAPVWNNTFAPVQLADQPNLGAQTVDDAHYLVREGKKNRFNFLVKPFKTVQLHVRIPARGYQSASIDSYLQEFTFAVPARPLDTILYLKAIPNAHFAVSGTLYAPDVPYLSAETSRYLGTADTTRIDLIFP